MKGLYKEYFQKSKVFLYPLLGVKKGVRFVPVQTYVSWGDSYTEYRNKLICLYTLDKDNIDEFEIFSDVFLESSDHFAAKDRIDMYNFIYVFDLKEFTTLSRPIAAITIGTMIIVIIRVPNTNKYNISLKSSQPTCFHPPAEEVTK